jgi:hypothetical protein
LTSQITFAYGRYVTSDIGCIVKQPVSAEDFIKELLYADKALSDVQIKKVTKPSQAMLESMAKIDAESQRANIEEAMRRGMRNPTAVQVTSDGVIVEYSCTKNGLRYEGVAMVGTRYTQMPDIVMWNTTGFLSIYAHEGKLAAYEKDIAAIVGNTSINPAWEEVRGQVTNYMQQQHIRGQQAQIRMQNAALQRQLRDNHEHIMRTQREAYANRQDSMSRINQGWSDHITDTDRWSGGGGSYSAPSGYNYGWNDASGNTYYTNDSTFNPNHSSDFRGDWSQMEKTPW